MKIFCQILSYSNRPYINGKLSYSALVSLGVCASSSVQCTTQTVFLQLSSQLMRVKTSWLQACVVIIIRRPALRLVCRYGPRRPSFCMEGCPVVRLIFFVWVWVDGALEHGWSFSENADWRPAGFPVQIVQSAQWRLNLIWDLCALWAEWSWGFPVLCEQSAGSSIWEDRFPIWQPVWGALLKDRCVCENMVTRIISVCLSQSSPLNQRYLLSPTIAL